ncbi:hypothetical protein HOLleu_41547 [Holothuria leucospilota]|uniref:Band 7 domain-containing protein n=1 Tax=Holothuria leucospilota TaxID=206669 RepID=A0A9Q0YBN7_HOLLE|nr:hypothetical protein HOLleu_41547 [Holothuria leucospilota]
MERMQAQPTHDDDDDTTPTAFEGWTSRDKVTLFVLVVVGLGILLMVIMIPRSFKKVEFYQYAFKRRKASGRVDTDNVYVGGRYHTGITFEFKPFPADAHFVYLHGLHVFTSDRLEVELDCSFQYFLRIEDLKLLHDTFDLRYKEVMRENARDALKSAVTQFSTRDFGTIRDIIEETLFQAIRTRLGGSCCLVWCDLPGGYCNTTVCIPRESESCGSKQLGLFANVRYFQLLFVKIPRDVMARNLQTLTQIEDAEREEYVQEYQVVQIMTQKMVQDINNEATEISQNATAHSDLIRARAEAEAQAIIESAHSNGLAYMYETLNITSEEQKASLNYLRTLRDHQNVHMSVNFQSLVNAPGFRAAN